MAKSGVNFKFEWYKSASIIIKDLGFDSTLNKQAAEIFYRTYLPYVPWSLQESSGNLANNVSIRTTNDGARITHHVPYAHAQWDADTGNPYGENVIVNRTRAINGKATSHWDTWAWEMHKKEIVKEVDKARIRNARMKH